MTSVEAEIVYILENSYSSHTWQFYQTGEIYFKTFKLISHTYIKQANQILQGPSQKKCKERSTYRIEHQMCGKVL